MLGEAPAEEARHARGQFIGWLKSLPWCEDEDRAHSGYESNCFYALIDSKHEPVAGARRSPERIAWRRLVWATWRAFTALQAQRRRLDLTAA